MNQARSLADEPHTALQALLGLVADAQSIDIKAWEDTGCLRLRAELRPRVAALLARGIRLFSELLGPEEEEPQDFLGGKLAPSHRFAAPGSADERLTDVIFFARGELRTRLAVLARLAAAEDRWLLVSLTGGALRKLIKVLTAVEARLAESEGRPPALSSALELEISLAVRHAYTRFRHEMERAGAESQGDVQAALRSAATGITKLIDLDIYGDLRIQDRVELRRLEERILAWQGGAAGSESGRQLWQEVLNVAHLVSAVNHRPELREHDRKILFAARGELRRAAPLSPASAALRDHLATVFGRDDALDTLVAHPGPVTAHDLLKPVEAIVRQLDPPASGEPQPGFDAFRSEAEAGMAVAHPIAW